MEKLAHNPLFGIMLFNVLSAWPFARILRRAGFRPWYALLVFIPAIGLLLVLAILGHRPWPNLPPRPPRKQRKTRRA
ncbi:DUF805 domain-containing protein [Azospirillaceae bacterium]